MKHRGYLESGVNILQYNVFYCRSIGIIGCYLEINQKDKYILFFQSFVVTTPEMTRKGNLLSQTSGMMLVVSRLEEQRNCR